MDPKSNSNIPVQLFPKSPDGRWTHNPLFLGIR